MEFGVRSTTATSLTTKQDSTRLPAADDTYLYWARNSLTNAAIMRWKKR